MRLPSLLLIRMILLLSLACPEAALAAEPDPVSITVSWWAPIALAVGLNAITSVLVFWFREANRRNEEAITVRISALEAGAKETLQLLAQTREQYATKSELERLVGRMDGLEQRLGSRLGELEKGSARLEESLKRLVDLVAGPAGR